jgi:large subunit ribosomal protein L2
MKKFLSYILKNFNKKLSIGIRPKSGRNFSGKICVHHKTGGNKNRYYNIDFYRRIESSGYLYKIIYNANRTSFLGGIIYENGLFSYIILTEKIKIGDKIISGVKNINKKIIGSTYLLKNIKLFTIINNIEMYPYSGSSLVRSAGTSAVLSSIDKTKICLKLKSGWIMKLSHNCIATLGNVSNMRHKFNIIGKAGKSFALGKKSKVRGVAMNPCDHPHGGGEGKKSPPSAQRSPWGRLTKGTDSLKKK